MSYTVENSDDISESSHVTSSKSKRDCPFCHKIFSTGYNLRRHIFKFHEAVLDTEDSGSDDAESNASLEEESNMDDSISNTSNEDSNIDSSSDSNISDGEVSNMDGVNSASDGDDTVIDEDFKTPMLIQAASNRILEKLEPIADQVDERKTQLEEDGMDVYDAYDYACQENVDRFNKNYRKSLVDLLIDMRTLHDDPRVKSLLKKARHFEKKGYDYDDALRAAMSRLKHMFNNRLQILTAEAKQQYEDDDDEEEEEEESPIFA